MNTKIVAAIFFALFNAASAIFSSEKEFLSAVLEEEKIFLRCMNTRLPTKLLGLAETCWHSVRDEACKQNENCFMDPELQCRALECLYAIADTEKSTLTYDQIDDIVDTAKRCERKMHPHHFDMERCMKIFLPYDAQRKMRRCTREVYETANTARDYCKAMKHLPECINENLSDQRIKLYETSKKECFMVLVARSREERQFK